MKECNFLPTDPLVKVISKKNVHLGHLWIIAYRVDYFHSLLCRSAFSAFHSMWTSTKTVSYCTLIVTCSLELMIFPDELNGSIGHALNLRGDFCSFTTGARPSLNHILARVVQRKGKVLRSTVIISKISAGRRTSVLKGFPFLKKCSIALYVRRAV